MRLRRIAWIAGATTLVATPLLLVAGTSDGKDSPSPTKRVRTGSVAREAEGQGLPFPGTVRAADEARLAFEVSGRLRSRSVDVGETVTAGQALAVLDDQSYRNARETAAARLAEIDALVERLERDARRVNGLVDQGAATEEETDQVTAALEAARASRVVASSQLQEAERRRAESILTAPFPGRVQDLFVEPGEWVAAGTPVLSVSGTDGREVVVDVPESVVSTLERGTSVRVVLTFSGRRELVGQVLERGLAATSSSGLFPVTIGLEPGDSGSLLPGMAAEIFFPERLAESLTVPLAAVVDPGGTGPRVLRVAGGRIEVVSVSTDRLLGDRVVVTGDLSEGDRIVVAGAHGLRSGQEVEVIE